ncbi:hypothetical protein R3P38DRAFT_598649 [Favolaschia claudopus]|uniref:Uncharacterized protein n=1 Tax=Favolaschia claudopus TaxID=2862362 RepID=A0AAV9Z7X3_9AGAR
MFLLLGQNIRYAVLHFFPFCVFGNFALQDRLHGRVLAAIRLPEVLCARSLILQILYPSLYGILQVGVPGEVRSSFRDSTALKLAIYSGPSFVFSESMISPSCTPPSAYLADVSKPSADPLIHTCPFEAKGEILGLRHCQAATQLSPHLSPQYLCKSTPAVTSTCKRSPAPHAGSWGYPSITLVSRFSGGGTELQCTGSAGGRISSLIDHTSRSSPGYTPKIMADGNSRQHAHDRAAGASPYISARKRHIRLETLRGVGAV